MPQLIQLEQVPSQQFTATIDKKRFDITLRFSIEVMIIDITRDDIVVLQGHRCLAKQLIIPYKYLEAESGNFYFTTASDEFPNYEQFGLTQNLWYVSNDELVEQRG